MKQKDLVYIVLAAIIFAAVGIVGYTQLVAPKQTVEGVSVEVIQPIKPDFDNQALKMLNDSSVAVDYTIPVDLGSGLNNTKPFSPF